MDANARLVFARPKPAPVAKQPASQILRSVQNPAIHCLFAVRRTNSVQEIKAFWSENTQTSPEFPQSCGTRSGYDTGTTVVAFPATTVKGAKASPLLGLVITQYTKARRGFAGSTATVAPCSTNTAGCLRYVYCACAVPKMRSWRPSVRSNIRPFMSRGSRFGSSDSHPA